MARNGLALRDIRAITAPVVNFILFVLIVGLGLMLFLTRMELRSIRQRLDGFEGQGFGHAPAEAIAVPKPEQRVAAKVRRTASVVSVGPPPKPEPPSPEPRASRFANLNFETLIGGKLPIWVGGIALVFAGFFLVRYTIEAGLFGPGARSITATIFALALIAVSELGGRIPKIGASFTADPRVGQSLAGAGVATLYGTLYMAAEIYGLIGIPTAFVLVVVTTAIAFALSLRHGPPTALMGLIGGFAAPWVAGMGASNLPTLLLYLAVFIAALFGLAVWRRWLWLLVLTSGGGALWSFAMLVTAETNLGLIGGFIAISGAGAILAALRFDDAKTVWAQLARFAPMLLAFTQLAILLPSMDFSAIAWTFYFALSALAIVLAWRDKSLLPLVAGALLIAVSPIAEAWTENGASQINVAMTLAVALLFGAAGHISARQKEDSATPWAIVGLAAPVLSWFTAIANDSSRDHDSAFAVVALLAAIPATYMAWEWHTKARVSRVQGFATAASALMLWAAGIIWLEGDYWASYSAAIALGVAAWAKVTGGLTERRIAMLPLAVAMLIGIGISYQFLNALGASLSGEKALLGYLPTIGDVASETLLPAVLISAVGWQRWFATGRKTRSAAFVVGGAGVAAFVWLIAKQPAAIISPSDFIRVGFAERTVFTQILFGLGWLATTQAKIRNWPSLKSAGWILASVALFRFAWFDMLLLNPVLVPQMVGPVPVANLATAQMALTAFWLWLLAREAESKSSPERGGLKGLSLGATIITVLVSIRQAVQGTLISGASIETGENYLYSAGLLALAIAWLVIGIRRSTKLLRVAGLSLLTVVTLKVFLVDAAALTGLLRILSFLGLGIALIGIGWAYGRIMGQATAKTPS